MLTLSAVSKHAASLVQSIKSDENTSGGLISDRTIHSADLLDRMMRAPRRMEIATPYRVIFDEAPPPGGRLAVFRIADDGSVAEVGRLVLA